MVGAAPDPSLDPGHRLGRVTLGPRPWVPAAALSTARFIYTATDLGAGFVLVAGGAGNGETVNSSAELYDSGAGRWMTTGSMSTARTGHTATLLPSGQVLAAGSALNLSPSAELYDPGAGRWTLTGSMGILRSDHTATLLPSGQVLVAGGFTIIGKDPQVIASAELYTPTTGQWTATGSMSSARTGHTATLLPSEQVLVAGGQDELTRSLAGSEEYDPVTGRWTVSGSLGTSRFGHTATLLPSGQVLAAGGLFHGDSSDFVLASAELHEPLRPAIADFASTRTTTPPSMLSRILAAPWSTPPEACRSTSPSSMRAVTGSHSWTTSPRRPARSSRRPRRWW